MTAEQIIKQIKLYPVLYDSGITQYRDQDARNAAWEDIARKLNLDVENVKTKWVKLRNSYTNALKRRYVKNASDTLRIWPWKFQKQMEFLLPHLKYNRKQGRAKASVDNSVKTESITSFIEESDSQYDSQYDKPESPDSSPKYVSPIEDDIVTFTPMADHESRNISNNIIQEFVDVMNAPCEEKYKRSSIDMDENDCFFLSMSKTLKKLPLKDQADIKFELHRLIYEAEKRHMKINSNS